MSKNTTSRWYSRRHKEWKSESSASAGIEASAGSASPELGAAFFANAIAIPGRLSDADFRATLGIGVSKKMISIRVDADVLNYFRKRGKGYQRMMNFALRAFMWREQQAEAKEQTVRRQPRPAVKKAPRRRASGSAG